MNRFATYMYQPNIPLGENGTLATGSAKHISLSLKAANEGMVLLKNDKEVLPFSKGMTIAVFGKPQFDYVRGGGGSGEVTCEYQRNIYEGFKIIEGKTGVALYEPVSDNYRKKAPKTTEKLVADAAQNADAALICISRFSWEGADRNGDVKAGDYYLSESEQEMVKLVTDKFKKVVVSLNIGGQMDTEWFAGNKKIQGVLLGWQAGQEGGLAVAETLTGISNPSGKLVDTFAKSFKDYPSSEHFNDSKDYVDYTEDIFVGYRYFETFEKASAKVNYCFGYGLSYTDFEIKEVKTTKEQTIVSVKNIGNASGKEVVQVYMEAPQGVLGKAKRVLIGYKKTKLLVPGEEEIISVNYDIKQVASFDDLGKIKKSAFILEKGDYFFYIGNSVRAAKKSGFVYKQKTDKVVEQLHSYVAPVNLKKRLLADGSYEIINEKAQPKKDTGSPVTAVYTKWTNPTHGLLTFGLDSVKNESAGTLQSNYEKKLEKEHPDFMKVAEGKETVDEFVAKLPVEELIEMLGGQPNTGVANTFGFGNFMEHNIPNMMTADGPAGVRINPGRGVNATAFPCATMLACTWNEEIIEQVGFAGGLEVRENHIALWLTPAMNIHRNPLCGRNFEYYSEDPFVTGKAATALIRGIQAAGSGACMKHFCCNNKEVDRARCDSRVSERALREIYLKGFEMAAKEGKPYAVMTCYNRVNGMYASERKDLLMGILRGEWGWEGMVTTDWLNYCNQISEIKAGNDLKMPIGEDHAILQAYKDKKLTRKEIEAPVKRILNTMLKFQ